LSGGGGRTRTYEGVSQRIYSRVSAIVLIKEFLLVSRLCRAATFARPFDRAAQSVDKFFQGSKNIAELAFARLFDGTRLLRRHDCLAEQHPFRSRQFGAVVPARKEMAIYVGSEVHARMAETFLDYL